MALDGGGDLGDALVAHGHGRHDRRLPAVARRAAQVQHRAQLANQRVGALAIGLVDHKDIGDLQNAGLDRLHIVAHAGHLDHQGGMRRAGDLDLALARADRREVGAGQSEVEIASAAHTTMVIEVPGMGDDVQAIKASILETPISLSSNKADAKPPTR